MDFNISDLIKQMQDIENAYIIETLKKYNLVTNDINAYEYFRKKYPEINICYAKVGDTENKIYVMRRDKIQPITLTRGDIRVKEEPYDMKHTLYRNIHLEAGGEIL